MFNKGYVTVFVCLLLAAILLIAITTITITDRSAARTKASTAVTTAMSSELANYNRLIFDRYHILLLDKNASGAGEGALEVSMEETLKTCLGEDFTVKDVEMSGSLGILDNGCSEFKEQINENFKYNVINMAVDKIMEKTSGNDEPIGVSQLNDMDNDIESETKRIEKIEETKKAGSDSSGDNSTKSESKSKSKGESKSGSKSESESETQGEEAEGEKDGVNVVDPRITLKAFVDAGLEGLLLPQDVSFGTNVVAMDELPSDGKPKNRVEEVKTSFTSISRMKMDAVKGNGWGESLTTYAEAVVYGSSYFNCLTEQKYDDTYLNFEMEYIIGGEDTDSANYKKVVDEILLIRFGGNLAYILMDSEKMAECEATALALTIYFPPAQPVVKYLLAGCWAYIESIADVYLLLRGHSVPFIKSIDTWTTDFESLSHLETLVSEPSDEERGLDYKEYLMILMALRGETMYYRMLDVMQLNVAATDEEYSDPDFRMSNAITAFGVNADINYGGEEFRLHEERGY